MNETMIPNLNELLKYEHPAVVARFKKAHPASAENAEIIFKDLLRFFWASKTHHKDLAMTPSDKLDFVFIMDDEMKEIDFMWHVFLLYTQDYMDFCNKYFGAYLHHLPDLVPLLEEGVVDTEANFSSNLEKFLDYNYDLLGEDVVRRWFAFSSATQ